MAGGAPAIHFYTGGSQPAFNRCSHREGVLRRRLLIPSGPSDAVMYSLVRES